MMKPVYTVGRAMVIVRVPDDVDVSELGESRLVVVAELYPPVQRLHDAMPYVRIESTTPAVLPFEAVEKLLGAYYSPREPRMYVFEKVFDNDGSTFVKLFEP
ncbi:BZ3500_MvSof-1268-A1-R1_Chr12-2g03782 [Microbotryum saponariae]|uniref:BZ3500_MvSof-1268-A1-R1_Chr12-2g03782 protein n=1 Tax=Microbotryum saponariae TaxID=289078 RepID=A0A2X0MPD3_9BASI|nr:BZ3500_MvSof-1268-A1-R1_Chr12-2g03782 [Microbotryum saponariae]